MLYNNARSDLFSPKITYEFLSRITSDFNYAASLDAPHVVVWCVLCSV